MIRRCNGSISSRKLKVNTRNKISFLNRCYQRVFQYSSIHNDYPGNHEPLRSIFTWNNGNYIDQESEIRTCVSRCSNVLERKALGFTEDSCVLVDTFRTLRLEKSLFSRRLPFANYTPFKIIDAILHRLLTYPLYGTG